MADMRGPDGGSSEYQDAFTCEALLSGEDNRPRMRLTPVHFRRGKRLLAYEMNGEALPVLHGAPLRLRVENQLGFKQVKWIKEIEFVHYFSERGASQGGYEDHEFYGCRDEI
jgi:DMSO/TMAO reductase YedYZ molybdopterin-dependent catalytic subunit